MPDRVLCEPVEMPPGMEASASAVALGAEAGEAGRFTHFHDVAEIVLFDRVRGDFVVEGERLDLNDGDVVFVPSMRTHDFELAAGEKAWTLVYVDPIVVEAMGGWRRPARIRPDAATRTRLKTLAGWLEAGADAATRRNLAELMLRALADQPRAEAGRAEAADGEGIGRLMPAIQRLRADPARPPTIEQAARACNLSPAYFSRRFKAALGAGFSDYSRVYRLHLAARRLLEGEDAIAAIAWATGFATPSHFTQCFRERFGVTPGVYRGCRSA
ncbi:AraC family transcriptional regulator [Brevundimonas sp.]|uniref:helix-turn-helix transcriptional regulator n=1 Tax=Brevundimonas sp. TaxID=1871086 RepID=UPI0035AF24E0